MTVLLTTLFRYKAWANSAFFDKLALMDPATQATDYVRAMRLMSHGYVVAAIFAAHLTGRQHAYQSDNLKETPELLSLRQAVAASDAWYLDYVRDVSPEQLGERIAFTFTDSDKGYMSREEMLMHVVLHGGYHRGEVVRILTRLSIETPWDTFAVFLHRDEPTRRLQGPSALLRHPVNSNLLPA